MLIRVRRTRTHPAADWTSANPWLEPLEMGIEEESPNKAKINFSDVRVRWNSLEYWNPAGSSPLMMVTATVQTNVGTKQALLAAVPTGKVRIVTQVVARNASDDLSTMADVGQLGYNAGSDNVGEISETALANHSADTYWQELALTSGNIGAAGDVLGIKFADTAITATLDIDTFFYDVDA